MSNLIGGGLGPSAGPGGDAEAPFQVEYLKSLPPCHPHLVDGIVTQIKSQGLFDEFRKTCLADIDTKVQIDSCRHR